MHGGAEFADNLHVNRRITALILHAEPRVADQFELFH